MKNTIIALFALLIISSCAKMGEIDNTELSRQSLTAWLAKYDPDAVQLESNEDIYVRYITHGPEESDSLDIVEYAWYRLNYSIYTLNGDLIATRDSTIAKRAGIWLNSTHWAPDYIQHYEDNGIYCDGLHDLVETLSKGDVVRAYIGTEASFDGATSMYLNSGYAGTVTDYQGFPFYCDIEIGDISHYVMATEEDSIAKYIAEWGLTLADSIGEGLYKRIITENPTGDTITSDTLCLYQYAKYFPDGFLIETNIETIADSLDREVGTDDSYDLFDEDDYDLDDSLVDVVYPTEGSSLADCYIYALLSMRKGETAEFYTFSEFTEWGMEGSTDYVPQISPLQPIRFVISVYDTVI